MKFRYHLPMRWATLVIVLLATVCMVATSTSPARADSSAAEKLTALDTSLNLIPADAAFYSSMLRNREQIEAIGNSRAWAKLVEMPFVQMGLQVYKVQSETEGSKAAMVKMVLENPQMQELLALLGDMFSNDVFVYGDSDMVGALQIMQEVGAAVRYGPAMLQIGGKMEGVSPDDMQGMMTLAVLAENIDRVKVPGMVWGFKIKDKDRATVHLGKLEAILGMILAQQGPEWADTLKHTEVDGQDYLVMTIPGSMLPWDEVPMEKLKALELEEGSVDKLIAKVKAEKLVIALGIRGDYLLISIGPSTEPLLELGKDNGLASRPEMAPLAKYAKERITSINYASKDFMEAANGNRQQIDDLMDFVEQILPSLELTKEQQAQIRKDSTELATVVKDHMPVVGAMSQVSFISKQGIESYSYNWSTHPGLDGSKPLGLLSHVGGSPLLAVVSRSKVSVEEYDLGVKWLGKAYGYFQQYAVPKMEDDEREQFEKFVEVAKPILARINETNREKLLPALDGQSGIVLDGKMTSKQYIKTLPATEEAMPMLEPAILFGLRNADLMEDALDDYWKIIKEVHKAVAEANPGLDKMPLPEPKEVKTPNGELYVFNLPKECPVDKQITPNVAVGPNVCVFSLSKAHSERLLKTMPLTSGGVLTDTSRPMAMAVVFDWAGFVQAVRPWAEMGVDAALVQQFGPDASKAQTELFKQQALTVLDLLSVLRCVTSEAYIEGDVMIIHTLTEIRDLD